MPRCVRESGSPQLEWCNTITQRASDLHRACVVGNGARVVVMRIIHCSSSSSSSSTRVVDTAWHIRRRRKAGAFCLFYTCTATQETAHSDGGGQWQRETRLRSAAANVQCARVARHAAGKRVCGVRRANVQCARVARHAEPQSVGVVTNNTVHNSSGCAQSCSRAFTDVPRGPELSSFITGGTFV